MRRFLFCLLTILYLSSFAYAEDECTWSDGIGEVAIDGITPKEAQNLALRQARYVAIEKALGSEVKGTTLVKDFALAGDFVSVMSKGYIKKETVLKWEQDKYQPTPTKPPITIYRVSINACVGKPKTLKDKSFHIFSKINKNAFSSGEKATIEIKASRNAYINVFNLTSDDKIFFYNQPPYLQMPIFLEEGQSYIFPPEGITLEMTVPDGNKKATEAFIIVATKDKINMPFLLKEKTSISLTEFYTAILSIEGDFVDEMVVYSVER